MTNGRSGSSPDLGTTSFLKKRRGNVPFLLSGLTGRVRPYGRHELLGLAALLFFLGGVKSFDGLDPNRFGGVKSFDGLDPNRFQVHELNNIQSPTSVLRWRDRIFLGADLMDAYPGIHRLTYSEASGHHAAVVSLQPQQDVQGLQIANKGEIYLVSSREFSADPKKWVNQVIHLDLARFNTLGREYVGLRNDCGNGSLECGLTGIHALAPNRWLAITKRRAATLYLLEKKREAWLQHKAVLMTLGGKYVPIVEMKVRDGFLLFLLRDAWTIAGIPLDENKLFQSTKLELRPLFDFSALKTEFRVSNARFWFKGLAEGFDFDEAGNLLVVLNNRGYMFQKSPNEILDRRPKLLVFPTRRPYPHIEDK